MSKLQLDGLVSDQDNWVLVQKHLANSFQIESSIENLNVWVF